MVRAFARLIPRWNSQNDHPLGEENTVSIEIAARAVPNQSTARQEPLAPPAIRAQLERECEYRQVHGPVEHFVQRLESVHRPSGRSLNQAPDDCRSKQDRGGMNRHGLSL